MTAQTILDSIPFHVNFDELIRRTHVQPGSEDEPDLRRLAEEAERIARPKALYLPAYIDLRGEDFVEIGGTAFHSRVLAVNLKNSHRTFPYIATCGIELHRWAESIPDMIQRYWADMLMLMALAAARQALVDHLDERFRLGKTATMSPGSLEDWPISQQRVLFGLLDRHGEIEVSLTPSMLMVPFKSVSGIRFPTESNFESCQLCPREDCPGRRAEYDDQLYEQRYKAQI
jgi:hypothetical protein